jgi:hypothetical protein
MISVGAVMAGLGAIKSRLLTAQKNAMYLQNNRVRCTSMNVLLHRIEECDVLAK